MKKICISIVSDKPVPAVNGGAIETLLQSLIDMNEIYHKYEFVILTIFSKKIDYSKYKYTKFITIPDWILGLNKVYWKIVGLVRKIFKFELIAPIQKYYEYFYLKKNYKKFDYIIEETDLCVFSRLYKKMNKNLIYHLHYEGKPTEKKDKCFNYLMSTSEFIGKNWKEKTNRSDNTIYKLCNCIDFSIFNKTLKKNEKKKMLKELNINEKDFVAIFIGRIIPEKGVLELLKAVENVNKENFSLLLIGSSNFNNKTSTDYEKKVKELIKKMKKNVVQVGYVDNKDLYKYQNIADFAIVPSLCEEAAGLVVLEAQAAKLPVIASKVGGIPEFLLPNMGILVNVTDNYIQDLSHSIEDMIDLIDNFKFSDESYQHFQNKFNLTKYYFRFDEIINEIDRNNKKE